MCMHVCVRACSRAWERRTALCGACQGAFWGANVVAAVGKEVEAKVKNVEQDAAPLYHQRYLCARVHTQHATNVMFHARDRTL